MSTVSWYGRELSSVFNLLGTHEPAVTRALGWTLARSSKLMLATLARLGLDAPATLDDAFVALEDVDELGRTDIEIRTPSAHVIIEAKVGWIVPGEVQLSAYAPRLSSPGGASEQRMVTLSDSSSDWAAETLPEAVGGAPVSHWSWDTVRGLVRDAKADARGVERLWLSELEDYLGSATSRRPVADALAYCVVSPRTRSAGCRSGTM